MPRLARPFVAALLALAARPVAAETLAEAIARAYRDNPDLQASRYGLVARDEAVAEAEAELRPRVDLALSLDASRTIDGRTTTAASPFANHNRGSAGQSAQLTFSQPLATGGRASADRDVALAGVAAGRDALRASEGDLLLAVVTAYVDVRRYTAAAALLDRTLADLERLDGEVAARQRAGELTRTDVALADGQLAVAREQRLAIEQALQAARAVYLAVVGHTPDDLAPPPPLPGLPADADAAFALASAHSPDLATAADDERASRAGIAVARAAGRPTLALTGNAGLAGPATRFAPRNEDQSYTAGLTLSVPISRGGAVAAQVRAAEARNAADRLRIESARRTLARAVANGWNAWAIANRLAGVEEARCAAAAVQLKGMTAEYRVGLRSTFDVFYAQQSLREAELARLAAEADRYAAGARVLRVAGLLEVGAVLNGTALHDPAAHLARVEERQALLTDGLAAMLDRIGGTHPRVKPLTAPPSSPAPEMRAEVAATGLPPITSGITP